MWGICFFSHNYVKQTKEKINLLKTYNTHLKRYNGVEGVTRFLYVVWPFSYANTIRSRPSLGVLRSVTRARNVQDARQLFPPI
jgi:hypothetical protein